MAMHAQQVTESTPPRPEYPTATVIGPPVTGEKVVVESNRQSEHDKVFVLDGAVVITSGLREVRADHIEYDSATGDVTASGHLDLRGGVNQERVQASHGSFNLNTGVGTFFDVTGSVGLAPLRAGHTASVYTNGQPFLFTGRMVVKTGPASYDLYDGSVTSCLLPKPDWYLTAAHFSVTDEQARARNSTFHLLGLPMVYLPYVTHPSSPETRESGFLIPSIPWYSSTKGLTMEEQVYLVLGRSADLTVGASYYSRRGFAQDATFRYKGAGLDFVRFHYTGLLDRLPGSLNQGGEDATLSARHDFDSTTRVAADVDYLSSYVYREAFTENFNQAVASDITSTIYGVREAHGTETTALLDRYQGIKLIAQGSAPQQQVRIFHVPTVAFATQELRMGNTPVEVSLDTSISGLKRTQPNFETGGVVERFDVHPEVSIPFSAGGWRFRPAAGLEETAYSRSYKPAAGAKPQAESLAGLSRFSGEGSFAVRPPAIERVFSPTKWAALLGEKIKHTVEPELTYRIQRGVGDFKNVLRFDALDVVADTDELEYGVKQRLFRKGHGAHSCADRERNEAASVGAGGQDAPAPEEQVGGLNPDPTLAVANEIGADATKNSCETEELISWRLTQKYFFNSKFGGAVVNGRRNIFDSTLNLSGVAFLTEARNISPLVSRLRVRASAHSDIEWDFDYDTGARKFTSSNVFLDLHATDGLFGALSYARLDAPGRFFTEGESTTTTTGVNSRTSDFNQLRVLVGFGNPLKPGLSVAGNTGLDLKSLYGESSTVTTGGIVSTTTVYPSLLQYATVQANYNWNCCGLSVEYRKFELGSVRNEGSYRFNFTLANIATVGNLRRAERLF